MPKFLGSQIPKFLKLALCGLLLAGLYHSAVTYMINQWNKPEYNYCYLIPFVVVYLIWEKRARLTALPSVPSWKGMLPFGFGLVLFWLGELGGEYFTLYISCWLVLVGLCWINLGWQKIKTIAFALFMILTMFPLPDFLYNKISVQLQLISSKLGVSLIQVCGMSAYREGNIIDLGFTQLQIVEACSGLRSLMSIIVLGLLMAYLFRAPFWKRALLLCSTLPLSIFANSVRIASTAFLYRVYGREVAEGFFHGFSGWLIFVFACTILLLEMWLLGKVWRGKSRIDVSLQPKQGTVLTSSSEPAAMQSDLNLQDGALGKAKPDIRLFAFLRSPMFVAAIIILAISLTLSQEIDFRERIPINRPLDEFPLQVSDWLGTRGTMDQRFIDTLDLSDYLIIDYRNSTGQQINLYVAYYESQRKGESIHSPSTCLPGSGWIFNESGSITLSAPGHNGGAMRVNRTFMHKSGQTQLVYYWFPMRGRILTNAYQLKLYTFWDALTKQRTDGALVRLITPVSDHETSDQADARLQGFAGLIVPVLEEYLPGEEPGI